MINQFASKLLRPFSQVNKKVIHSNNISQKVINSEYAVRGILAEKASQYQQQLAQGKKLPFDEVAFCNIGNPQAFGQAPFSFNRQVLSGILNPSLIKEKGVFHQDVINRVQWYQKNIQGNVGAYSDSRGYMFARDSVASYIAQRDNCAKPSVNDLVLLDGASQGVHICLQAFIQHSKDGIIIPIPQYPLYSAAVTLQDASQIFYYLNESQGWSLNIDNLKKQCKTAKRQGINPKILCVINPGNPTGQVMSKEVIQDIIKFAYENKLIIFADEVYQNNIYAEGKQFHSFNKVRSELGSPYDEIEMISFHSTSKGLIGECGLRGGFMQLTNLDEQVQHNIIKLKSINLCSNTIGQLTTELLCNPPSQNNCSAETFDLYTKEKNNLFNSLKQRAKAVSTYLNQMENITCNEVEGAMYAFPRIRFSDKVIQEAAKRNQEADMMYCLDVLDNTGIVLVPGSGFGQEEGTYHFRITTLILPEKKLEQKLQDLKLYTSHFHSKFK